MKIIKIPLRAMALPLASWRLALALGAGFKIGFKYSTKNLTPQKGEVSIRKTIQELPTMPSGKTHDRLTYLTSLALIPAAVAVSLSGQPITLEAIGHSVLNGAIASLCCLVSGIWLSPDVDVKGYLDRRYGALQFIWSGYYWLCHLGKHYRSNGRITHRSYLSHSPIVGSASKVLYLGVPALLITGHWSVATIYNTQN